MFKDQCSMFLFSLACLVSTIAQPGIAQSGAREVAEANGTGDPERARPTSPKPTCIACCKQLCCHT